MAKPFFGEKPLTKTQRYHHYYVIDAMRRFEWDMHHTIAVEQRIPFEWHEISTRRKSAKKKICFSVDEDVVKWFKSMGPGYQGRMSDVLRSFMHAKLSGLVHGDETLDAFREGMVTGQSRPDWGKSEAQMDEINRRTQG